jgi:hypothetical protein
MKIMKKLLIIIGLFSFSIVSISQTAITVCGGQVDNITYSIGQTFYTENLGIQNSSFILSIEETDLIDSKLDVYPNPTQDFFYVKIDDFKDLELLIYDIKGNLIKRKILTEEETRIETHNFSSSIHFIHIVKQNQILQTIKLTKI